MTSTEILYVDCNRQNSIKSSQLNSEWEYNISDEALVLPAGTQIMVQDTFINKRGISANSIEIEEDIDERIDCSFYFNYDPKWQPKGESQSDPAIQDYEGLYIDTLRTLGANETAFAQFQRTANKLGLLVNSSATVRGQPTIYTQPRRAGFPNVPLPCVRTVRVDGQPITEDADLVENWSQVRVVPETRSIRVFIPKGVYGLSELAELIEDQMTGRLVNVANGDFNKDYVQEKNEDDAAPYPLVMNDNDRLCINKRSFKDEAGNNADYNFSNAYGDVFTFANNANSTPVGRVLGSRPVVGVAVNNIPNEDPVLGTRFIYLEIENPLAMPNLPAANGVILLNGEYISYGSFTFPNADGNFGGVANVVRLNNCIRGCFQGATGQNPDKYNPLFTTHAYQRLDASAPKFHDNYANDNNERANMVANGQRARGRGLFEGGNGLNFRVPDDTRGIFTLSESFNQMCADYKRPVVANDPYLNRYNYSNQLSNAAAVISGSQTGNNHGNAYPNVDYIGMYYIDDFALTNGINAKNFNYNPTRRGYYVGAPEFKFEWDTEESAFSIRNLHHPFRINSHDQYGNAIEGEGDIAIETRRLTQTTQQGTPATNNNFIHENMRRSFENHQDRYGGVSVYNWARVAARKYADVDYTNPAVFNQDFLHLLTWDDYFSSKEKAKDAWSKTLWGMLGFSYDQLANTANYELPPHRFDSATTGTNYYGTTTRGAIDSSINPNIATTYNPNDKEYFDLEASPIRAYNHCDVNTSFLGYTTNGTIPITAQRPNGGAGDLDGVADTSKSFFSSNYQLTTTALIATGDRPLIASGLPRLNSQGYLIVSSDIIDTHEDSIKNSQNLPMIGVVPLGTFSSQDFITSENQMIHILAQDKIVNKIKIKIKNPDLTPANLDEFSSVILKIVRPVQPPTVPLKAQETPEMKRNKERGKNYKN
jgi:hypothetical protein